MLSTTPTAAALLNIDPFGDRTRPGAGAAFVCLAAFLISFLAIRTSARMTRSYTWWPGGVKAGNVHVHHLVWGICLMLLSGFLALAAPLDEPLWHIAAIGFGVGAGLTLDEFALWVRLEDVYWTDVGRTSFDAVICTCAFAALVVIGSRPFGLDESASIWGTVLVVALDVVIAGLSFAKGRVLLGVIGLFIPLFALVGAVRLARPASPWAHWRYGEAKLDKSRARFAATRPGERMRHRLGDLIAGAPTRPD